MVLHKIILKDFKSYKGTHILGPFDPFSCIVGLNGSGKSNLMDAVCFALSVNSSFLRTSNLTEIINKESKDAFVEIFLSDNEDKENQPVKSQETTTVLKRTINNKGTSNYFINNKSISHTDYISFLHSINIFPKSKNFLIFQGEVDAISLKEPKEMTKLVEEISESSKYKKEYELREEKMNLLFSECQQMYEKKKEMNNRLKEIAEGKDQEKKFKEKIKTKDEIYAKLKLSDIKIKNEEMQKVNSCIKTLEEQRENTKKQIKELNIDDKDTNMKLVKEIMDIENEIEILMFHLKEINRKDLENQVDKNNAKHISKNIKDLQTILDAKRKKEEMLKNEIEDIKKIYDNEMCQIDEQYKKFEITDSIKATYFKLEEKFQESVKALAQEMKKYTAEIKPSNDKMKMLAQNNSGLETSIKNYDSEINFIQAELKNTEYKVKVNSASINVIKDKQKSGLDKFQKLTSKEKELNDKLSICIKDILSLKSEQKQSEQKLRMNDCIEHLKLNIEGVYGKVIDLVTITQKKYETAISVLLSGFSNAVIVEDDKVAIKCIEYIKIKKIGRITFLPITALKPVNIDYNYRKDGIMAIDTINYTKSIEPVINFIFDNSLIAKSTDDAKKVLYEKDLKLKICTLDGVLFHKNGNITGGKILNQFSGNTLTKLLTQKNEIMAQLKTIKEAKNAFSHIEVANDKIIALENDNANLREHIDQENIKLIFLRDKIAKYKAVIKENLDNIKSLESQIFVTDKRIQDLQSKLNAQENKIFKDFEYGNEIKNFKNFINNRETLKDITNLKYIKTISAFETELNAIHLEIQMFTEKIQEFTNKLSEITHDGILCSQTNHYQEKLRLKKDELTEFKDLQALSKQKYDHQKNQIKNLVNKMASLDNNLRDQQRMLARIKEDILDNIKMMIMEEVSIPLKSNTLRSTDPFAIELSEEILLKNINLIDFAFLIKNKEAYAEEYQQIVKDLEDCIPISKHKDISKTQNSYSKINSDYDELRKEALFAKEEFNKIKTLRIDAFMTCYNIISQSISKIYKTLTKRDDTDGNAYILLENNTEPYKGGLKYFAMPPFKRYREMQALSGGEKTMAALALLFSIHAYKPAPFYLFDEMDSALDKINMSSIVDYISNSGVQFVIITLKPSFFQHADGLIGIYKQKDCSRILSYRLEP